VHFLAYIIAILGAELGMEGLATKELLLDDKLQGQWEIAVLSIMIGVIATLFFGLFRFHRFEGYRITSDTLLSLALIELVSLCLEWFIYSILDIKNDEISTTFILLPLIVGSFILLLGNFISNDYHFMMKTDRNNTVIRGGRLISMI
jgi:hypothetical protein